jgi:hypothetical protein
MFTASIRLYSRLRSARTRAVAGGLLLAAVLLSLALASVAPAFAEAPAAVTVEVEGLSETKLPPTPVTTTTTPVVKDNSEGNPEGSCPGTTAIGALQVATAGNWSGPWSSKYNQYEIFSIEGEAHEFEPASKANYYWSFWLNDQESSVGACEAQLEPGDRVLFFPACYGEACPVSPTPLAIEAPATADAGENVSVTVKQYNAKGEASPAIDATVSGGGTSAFTEIEGHASLRFSGDGTYTLHVVGSGEQPPSVRTETSICVHEGNDGTCGTPQTPSSAVNPGPSSVVNTMPLVPVETAKVAGVKNGHHYSRRTAPRLLEGSASVTGSTLQKVEISLQRKYKGHCFTYSGSKEKFVRAKCSATSFFSVGDRSSFSYLLPARLPAGRYVYELKAVDGAGRASSLTNGVSRFVFYVG